MGMSSPWVKDMTVWLNPDRLSLWVSWRLRNYTHRVCYSTHPLAEKRWLSSPQMALSEGSPQYQKGEPKKGRALVQAEFTGALVSPLLFQTPLCEPYCLQCKIVPNSVYKPIYKFIGELSLRTPSHSGFEGLATTRRFLEPRPSLACQRS